MVKLKYPAIYSDNLGCDKGIVYFSENNFQLKVRGYNFYSKYSDFDFYAERKEDVQKCFYLKDNELIEYMLDIRIKVPIISNNSRCIEKAILRVERQKNYYSNTLLFEHKGEKYEICGIDFNEMIRNLKKQLPNGCDVKTDIKYLLNA